MTAYLETGRHEAYNFYGGTRVVVRNEPQFINVWDARNGAREETLPSQMTIVEKADPSIRRQVRVSKGNNFEIIESHLDPEGQIIFKRVESLTGEEINERDIRVNPHNLKEPVRLRWREGNPIRRLFGVLGKGFRLALG